MAVKSSNYISFANVQRHNRPFPSSPRFWQSQFSLRVTQIVIRVTMSEKTLKINAVKWPRIYIQT